MNVLIVGFGSIAQKHLHALKVLRNDIVVYALRSGKDIYHSEEVKNIYSLEELPVMPDFVIISNPTAYHYETIEKMVSLRVPLFIEKPLLHRLDNGEFLVDRCLEAGIKTYIACNLRFHPCVQFLKNYIEGREDEINEVNVYCGSYLPDWRPQRDFRDVYSTKPEMGGGVHLDLIHELDYSCWLFGNPQRVSKILRSESTLEVAVFDFAHYNLWYDHFTVNITLNYYRRDIKREIEIVMKDQTLTVDLVSGQVHVDKSVVFATKVDIYHTYIEQMKYFIGNIEGKGPFMNNILEAFTILKICLQ